MITAIIFLIVLSVIIFVHEFGHFVMAKRAAMKVEEFGFGFPPRIWGYKPKDSETTYSINWIPFGGFVKILGEDGTSENSRSFTSKGFWPRLGVMVAGVAMNIILAIVIFIFANAIGARVPIEDSNLAVAKDVKIQVTRVVKSSPAEQAQIEEFDEIIGFETVEEVQAYISAHKGQMMTLSIRRGEKDFSVQLTPRENPPPGEGATGIALARLGRIPYAWYEAIWRGPVDAITGPYGLWPIVKGFALLIKSVVVPGSPGVPGVELAGPISIAVILKKILTLGFGDFLQAVAYISLNIAFINILPFPALDGGRLFFLLIEKIKGSPLPRKMESTVNMIGFTLLLILMLYVTTKDVLKFF